MSPKLPSYVVPEQDQDLLECGVVLTPERPEGIVVPCSDCGALRKPDGRSRRCDTCLRTHQRKSRLAWKTKREEVINRTLARWQTLEEEDRLYSPEKPCTLTKDECRALSYRLVSNLLQALPHLTNFIGSCRAFPRVEQQGFYSPSMGTVRAGRIFQALPPYITLSKHDLDTIAQAIRITFIPRQQAATALSQKRL